MKCRSPLAVTLECLPLDVRGPQPSVCVGRGRADTPSCHVPMSGDVCTWMLADGLYRWDDTSRDSSERPGHALRRACPPYGQGLALAMWPEACPQLAKHLGRAGALSLRSIRLAVSRVEHLWVCECEWDLFLIDSHNLLLLK